MADHHMTINYEKSGAVFNTLAEAHQAHLDAIGDGDTVADYNTYAAALSGVTSTTFLTSGGSAVAAGSPGNGYSIKQIWAEAALKTDITDNGSTDTSSFETGGWTSESIDVNGSTGDAFVAGWHLS